MQMLEFTYLALHRANWDTWELAEQDVIMAEAFQNRPSELQKRKRKNKKDTASNTFHYLPVESKTSSWKIKELSFS